MKKKSTFKILLITDIFDPTAFGGAEIYFFNLAKQYIKKDNTQTTIICRTNNRRLLQFLNIPIWTIPYTQSKLKTAALILVSVIVYNVFLFLRRFNAIIINHPFCYLYTLLISPKKKVIIFHSPWCFEYKYRTPKFKKVAFLIRYLIEKFVYQNATNIITLSTYSKRVCSFLFKVNRANIHIIPPSVDIEEFEQITDKNPQNKILAEASHKIVFLTARAMIPRTGINLLIDAIELIKDKLHNTLFLIAGEGPYLEQYRQLVAKKGLSDIVKFVGFLEREKLITYFYTSDCFILPSSKLEGFGLVLLEAMYANLPIIATPVGAIPEVLKNMPYCYLTKSKTPQALAEKILEFIDNKINKSNINLKERFLKRYPTYQQIADQILTLIK